MPDAITFAVEGGSQAGWVFTPPGAVRSVLLCLPGGTYDKRYWHLQVPGHAGYSFAEHLAAQGHLVVALDHLGVGESSRPELPSVGLDVLMRGDAAVAHQVRDRFADRVPFVGVGHSMGACLTSMVQAEDRPYDAVALLGYGVDIANVPHADPGADDARWPAFCALAGARPDDVYATMPRALLHDLFHAPDVPPAVVEADDAAQSVVPLRAAFEVTTPGFLRAFAARVDVPVFLGLGELDVAPDPWAEPACYRASRDITVFVLPGSHHCHNMASRRTELWDRIGAWVASVAPLGAGPSVRGS